METKTLSGGKHVHSIHSVSQAGLVGALPAGKLVTKIHEKWYDLTDFEKLHPGGPVALGLAANRDATVLFESHHPFVDRKKLDAMMEKYELSKIDSRGYTTLEERHGIPDHPFVWKSEFGDSLRFQVKEYFEVEAKRRGVSVREATKATPERWLELAVTAGVVLLIFSRFVGGDWSSLFLFPLSLWMLCNNSYHDAAHFALHTNWRINAFVPYLFPYFSSPFTWYHQHVIGHHSFTNVGDRDPDLMHHYWLKREHKSVAWTPLHESQRKLWFLFYWWAVGLELGLATSEDLWMLMKGVYNKCVPMALISKKRLAAHVAGRVLANVVIHAWPFFVLDSLPRAFVFSIVPYVSYSLLFMMNTQINHLTPDAAHAEDKDWFKHQVVTAQDFGVRSRFCYLFSGGLNFQIVHHLFPTVNHCHLLKLQPIVVRLCEKYGVDYKAVDGYVAAIKSHHTHTLQMSYNKSKG